MAMNASGLLVTGAGVTGGEVLRQLTEAGIAPRAMVRNPEKAAPYAALGVELVQGDFAEREAWDRALAGMEKVFVITPLHPQAEAWFDIFLEAAKDAGVRHVVKLSGWRVSPDSQAGLHRRMAGADDALKASGLGYTILRPNVFFQNMFMMADSIRARGSFQSAVGDASISMIDVRDIAAVAVAVLTGDGHLGHVYDMSGPESLTYSDVARLLSQELGKDISYVPLDAESAVKSMVALGTPEPAARARVDVHLSFSNGVFTPVSDVVQDILGRPPLAFARFAHDYAGRFR